MSTPRDADRILSQLDPKDRAVVDLLAAFFAPTTLTSVVNALGNLGVRVGTRAPRGDDVRPLLIDLTKRGLVVASDRYRVTPELGHATMLAAAREGTLDQLASIVRALAPARKESFKPFTTSDMAAREIRLELHARRWEAARGLAKELPRTIFDRVCEPFDQAWIATFPADLRAHALAGIVETKTANLEAADVALAMLEAEPQLTDNEHRVLVERLILSGRLDDAERRLEGSTSIESAVGRAFTRLVRGRTTEAVEAYEAAHARYAKIAGRRALVFPDRAGLFFVVALLAEGTKPSLDRAAALARSGARAETLATPYAMLHEVVRLLEGAIDPGDSLFIASMVSLARRDPIEILLQAASAVWTQTTLPDPVRAEIEKRCASAKAAGLRWYADEAGDLLARLSGRAPPRGSGAILAELVKRRERWSEVLGELVEVAGAGAGKKPALPVKASAEATRRLAWLVRKGPWEHVSVEPREQARTKEGWSTGKPVALKRLHEQAKSLGFLTTTDLAVCELIEATTSYEYFGRYARVDYSLEAVPALRKLAGQPNLLLVQPDGSQGPCEVRVVAPRVEVKRRAGTFSVELVPRPRRDEDTQSVHASGATGVEIVEFTPVHHAIAKALGKTSLEVPASGEKELRAALQALSARVEIQADLEGDLGSDADDGSAVPGDARPCFLLRGLGDGISVAAHVRPLGAAGPIARAGRGGATFLALVAGRKARAVRDLDDETRRLAAALEACPTLAAARTGESDFVLSDRVRALEAIVELRALGDACAVEWPDGEAIRVSDVVGSAQLRLKITSDQGDFLARGALAVPGRADVDLAEVADLLSASPGRFLRLAGDERYVALAEELRARLTEILGLTARSGERLRIHPLAAPVVAELLEPARVEASEPWRRQLARFTPSADEVPVPSTLRGDLRPYQLDGFRWLARLSRWGAGGCLADDMGLGKTIQTIALLLHRASEGPALVVAPTSVVPGWVDELERFAPTLRVRTFTGAARAKDLEELGPFDVVVASYGLLQIHVDAFAAIELATAVLDEAQLVKNAETRRARAVLRLKASLRIATTGTPIENRLDDLHSIFSFLNPGLLGSAESFQARFARPIEKDGDANRRHALRKLVAPFVLRRTKTQVLPELPARTEVTLRVPLGLEEMATYELIREQALAELARSVGGDAKGRKGKEGQARFQILAAITRLRLAASNVRLVLEDAKAPSAKLAALGDLLDELLPNQHKLLVFSQFVSHLALVKEMLDERGVSYQYLDGSTPMAARRRSVLDFQGGKGDVFLVSLKAGGFGLNLTAADYVVHMDPWWNPAVEDQASDRAHRIGQSRPVTIYRIVARDTIEDRILALHHRKRELAEGILEGSDLAGRMSEEDLLDLIRNPSKDPALAQPPRSTRA